MASPASECPPTDLEVMLSREDLRLVPLRRGDIGLLEGLPTLGRLAATTANACVTCTRWGLTVSVDSLPGGTAVFDQGTGLRWMGEGCRHAAAALHREDPGRTPSFLFFGERGELAHRLTLVEGAEWEAFRTLVMAHLGCPCCLRPRAPAPSPEPRREARLLREGDRALKARGAQPLAPEDLARVLDRLSQWALPTHIQVGNGHCIQMLECTLERVDRPGDPWKLQGEDVLIRLDPSRIRTFRFQDRPGSGGRFESYDPQGNRVLTLGRPLTPCPAIQSGWDRLLDPEGAG